MPFKPEQLLVLRKVANQCAVSRIVSYLKNPADMGIKKTAQGR